MGFGMHNLRPREAWGSDINHLTPSHSHSPFDEVIYYFEAISEAAPRNNELHRLRLPEDYSQTFTAKINPFTNWNC